MSRNLMPTVESIDREAERADEAYDKWAEAQPEEELFADRDAMENERQQQQVNDDR